MTTLAFFYVGYTLFRLGLDVMIANQRKTVNEWNVGKEWD